MKYNIDDETKELLITVLNMTVLAANLQVELGSTEALLNVCDELAERFNINGNTVLVDHGDYTVEYCIYNPDNQDQPTDSVDFNLEGFPFTIKVTDSNSPDKKNDSWSKIWFNSNNNRWYDFIDSLLDAEVTLVYDTLIAINRVYAKAIFERIKENRKEQSNMATRNQIKNFEKKVDDESKGMFIKLAIVAAIIVGIGFGVYSTMNEVENQPTNSIQTSK